jgi:hypothetical protein
MPLLFVAGLLAVLASVGLAVFIVAVVLSLVAAILIFAVCMIPLAAVAFAIFALID